MKYAFCIVAADFKWSLLTLFQFESDNAKEVCDDNTFCKNYIKTKCAENTFFPCKKFCGRKERSFWELSSTIYTSVGYVVGRFVDFYQFRNLVRIWI